ncbi:hypothetical protein R83H12_02272 [Fibrobacteria bacterium R8-3-H12]
MNKYFLIIILAIIANTRVFSQENNNWQQNAVSIDFGTLIWDLSTGGFGAGASYERSVHNMFSVLGHFSYSYHDWNYFAFEAHGRLYPLKTSFRKLFADICLGYGLFWDNYSNADSDWAVNTMKISTKAGWKFAFDKGFFFEPIIGFGFPFIITDNRNDLSGASSDDLKISWGLGIGLNIGWAF